ncbi:hypothetical protein Tsubulata_023352, partial [Turnera subulata]
YLHLPGPNIGFISENYAMPSPAIPRSSSDPFLSCSTTASAAGRARLPPSNRSACSSRSSKSSYWLAWSNINKLGSFVLPGRKSTDSSSRHSDLTEEGLQAHNRRQEAIILNVDDKNAKCSPYYKGLTDATLTINRERHHYLPQSSSPGRESHATTVATSHSLSSTIIFKMQEWGSCFSFSYKSAPKEKENSTVAAASAPITLTHLNHSYASSCPPASRTPLEERKNTSHCALSAVEEEKPLRERVVITSKPPAPATPVTIDISDDDKKETLLQVGQDFIWANKYQPKALKDFICNRDQAIRMQGLMREVDCNHFIFEGPAGVGKRTMIWAMLQEAFGPDRVQTREECKAFDLKGEPIGSINVRVKVSSQHVEVNLSDMKGYEKQVIVDLIKETHNERSNNVFQSKLENCQAIILYEADKLSTDALLYIKWLLERYKGFSKFFFCCGDVSKLQPIRTLCTVVQLFPPSKIEVIVEVLEFIAKQEGIELPHQMAEKIADKSKNNLRQAIRSFEATWHNGYPFTKDQEILTGWEDDIANIARNIVQEQSPKQLYIIRGKLQNLIEHDVSPDFIFETLVGELKKHLDDPFQHQIESLYKDYNGNDGNHVLENGSQLLFLRSRHEEDGKRLNDHAKTKVHHFIRIEEFIAKFMSFYKLSVSNTKVVQQDREGSRDLSSDMQD